MISPVTHLQEKKKYDGTDVVDPTLILARALIREANPAKLRLVTGQTEKSWATFAMGSHQYNDQHNGTPRHKGVVGLPFISVAAAVREATK